MRSVVPLKGVGCNRWRIWGITPLLAKILKKSWHFQITQSCYMSFLHVNSYTENHNWNIEISISTSQKKEALHPLKIRLHFTATASLIFIFWPPQFHSDNLKHLINKDKRLRFQLSFQFVPLCQDMVRVSKRSGVLHISYTAWQCKILWIGFKPSLGILSFVCLSQKHVEMVALQSWPQVGATAKMY